MLQQTTRAHPPHTYTHASRHRATHTPNSYTRAAETPVLCQPKARETFIRKLIKTQVMLPRGFTAEMEMELFKYMRFGWCFGGPPVRDFDIAFMRLVCVMR